MLSNEEIIQLFITIEDRNKTTYVPYKQLSKERQELIQLYNEAYRDKYLTALHKYRRAQYELEFAQWVQNRLGLNRTLLRMRKSQG